MERLRPGLFSLLIAIGASACSALLPLTPEACRTALLEGTLVRGDDGGLAVHNADVDVAYPVSWPDDWSTRDVEGVRQIVDGGGRPVGREGDRFSAGGGFTSGPNEVFEPCGEIQITPASD
jgi:hypothetical protein